MFFCFSCLRFFYFVFSIYIFFLYFSAGIPQFFWFYGAFMVLGYARWNIIRHNQKRNGPREDLPGENKFPGRKKDQTTMDIPTY